MSPISISFARCSVLTLVLGAAMLTGACNKKDDGGSAVKKDDIGTAVKSEPVGSSAAPAPRPALLAEQVALTSGVLYYKSADGAVKAWGAPESLTGTSPERAKPVVVADLAHTKRLAVGGGQTMCAVMADGSAKCWGNGASGELGDGKERKSDKPVVVPGVTNAAAIGVGSYYVCALIADGTVKCWGSNSWHQASVEAKDKFVPPTTRPGVTGAQQIAVSGTSACALSADGSVKCWGLDCGGEGPKDCEKLFTVAAFAGATTIAAGADSVCVVVKEAVQCFGSHNEYGQLGTGTTESTHGKISAVKGLAGVKDIAGGQDSWCALMKDGTVQCWGSNEYGQLGDGNLPAGDKWQSRATPAPVKGLTDAVALTCGYDTCCAQLKDKSVKCWGENSAEFGDPNDTSGKLATPVAVSVN